MTHSFYWGLGIGLVAGVLLSYVYALLITAKGDIESRLARRKKEYDERKIFE